LWPWDSQQFCCQGRSIIKSKGIMIEIIIPSIFVEYNFLTKLPLLGPSVLFILSKMTHFFSSFVDLSLKIGQPSHLLLFPLYLLMDDFHVPDLLVQLLLLECWTSGLSLLASSLLERKSLLVCVQWLQCSSPCRCYLLRRHDEGQCLPKVVEVSTPEVGANVGDLFSNAMN
jgi:hypothetical protein